MRLLDVNTLQLSSFDGQLPKYAIASHRWTDEETSFDEFKRGRNTDKAGYNKVVQFCTFVQKYHRDIEWLWIDTCCIDKKSSSELSESINSMFRWYAEADLCFAYLQDVLPWGTGIDAVYESCMSSEWFGRGWTLQELLAPQTVIFLTQDWKAFGKKGPGYSDLLHLELSISDLTGIPPSVLFNYENISSCSDDQKWTWVEGRVTKRDEDMAYCLLGIFDVNMDLRYGEGGGAIERLREEIRNKKRREKKKQRAVLSKRYSTLSVTSYGTDGETNNEQGSWTRHSNAPNPRSHRVPERPAQVYVPGSSRQPPREDLNCNYDNRANVLFEESLPVKSRSTPLSTLPIRGPVPARPLDMPPPTPRHHVDELPSRSKLRSPRSLDSLISPKHVDYKPSPEELEQIYETNPKLGELLESLRNQLGGGEVTFQVTEVPDLERHRPGKHAVRDSEEEEEDSEIDRHKWAPGTREATDDIDEVWSGDESDTSLAAYVSPASQDGDAHEERDSVKTAQAGYIEGQRRNRW